MKDPIYTPNSLEELDVFAARLSQAMGDVFDMPISAKKQQKLREVMCRTFGYENGLQSLKPFFEQSSGSDSEGSGLVHRLQYGTYLVIARDGVLVDSVSSVASDENYQYVSSQLPHSLVNDPGSIVDVTLPMILEGDYDAAEIIYLADLLGYFQYRTPFYEALKSARAIEHKGNFDSLDSSIISDDQDRLEDLFLEIYDELGENWHDAFNKTFTPLEPKFNTGSLDYQLIFSMGNIGKARYQDGYWLVPFESREVAVKLHYPST